MGQTVAIHTNFNLDWQVRYARALKSGFERHGIEATVTGQRAAPADLHVCMGPWYALAENIGNPVLYLDRAFWGDPDCVSLHWLDVDGRKVFNWDCQVPRPHPDLEEPKRGAHAVILCDYGDNGERLRALALPQFTSVQVRRHPSNSPPGQSLESCLRMHQVAIGGHSTAMVEAAIQGLAVVCPHGGGPVEPIAGRTCRDLSHRNRRGWIQALAWHNWRLDEIESGEAWQHLQENRG